ncbi:MAG: type II toxin-antitoxin system VapC family toxin [Bacteroidales bacterium]|nr:type II toxin-antitoxin system VapC family toxin [Bacteroidales bacterium]
MLRGDKKKDKFWISFFKQTNILAFNDRCSQIASEIYKELKQQNNLIGTDDILIAATAISHNFRLATLNTKDFKRVRNIKLLTN